MQSSSQSNAHCGDSRMVRQTQTYVSNANVCHPDSGCLSYYSHVNTRELFCLPTSQTLLSPSEGLLLHPLTRATTPSNIRENHGIVTGNVNARSSVPSTYALAPSNSRGSDTPHSDLSRHKPLHMAHRHTCKQNT